MAKLNGTSMRVVVNGVTIGGTRSFTLDPKMANIDTSSKDSEGWTNRIGGKRDWTVTFDGLYDPSETFNYEQLFDLLDGRTRVFLEMAVIDGTGGGEKYSGYALIAGHPLTAPYEDVITISGTFEADGDLNKGTVASS